MLLTLLCMFVCICFFQQGEEEVDMSATELLYQGILPSLPQYMVKVYMFVKWCSCFHLLQCSSLLC